MQAGPNATHEVGVVTPSWPPSQPGAAEMVGKKRKQPSPLSNSIYTAAAFTPGVALMASWLSSQKRSWRPIPVASSEDSEKTMRSVASP